MPKLLLMIVQQKRPEEEVQKFVLPHLGPKLVSCLKDPAQKPLWKQMIKDALGPIAHTAVAGIAASVLELVLLYLADRDVDMDAIVAAFDSIGLEAAFACLCLVFPPAQYANLLLTAARWVLGREVYASCSQQPCRQLSAS